MSRGFVLICLACFLLMPGCVDDNEQDLFPRPVLSDTAFQGELARYTLDSGLYDLTGLTEPLEAFGDPAFASDHMGQDSAAYMLDGFDDYFRALIGNQDTLAVSLWFLPLPNYQEAILFDYAAGCFSAGLDAVTTATMPRFRLFMRQDTQTVYYPNEIDYFYWHHLYIEIGDTTRATRMYLDGYPPETDSVSWEMHPLIDLFYIGRVFNEYLMDSMMYRGIVDEIRLFNQPLSEEEILNLYWEGNPLNR